MMRRPAALRARPVSVMSTTTSTMSGTFASVAPYERRTSASTPAASRWRFVISGYSVETFTPAGRSAIVCHGESSGTAMTMRTGLAVAFEYFNSPSDSTWLEVSSIQSRPVMPRSKSPSAT